MAMTDTPIRLDEIHDLRASLPDLMFNPPTDQQPPVDFLAEKYLRFYQLDMGERYFHRWGRVILPPYTIASHYWLPGLQPVPPEKGMVVLVHGYFDHAGLYGHLIRFLLESGYGVVVFDLPGHGLSSGERASIDSFDHYVEVLESLLLRLRSQFTVPISAIGQSTGGAVLLKHLSRSGGEDLARVALLAPLVEPALWWLNRIIYALTHRHREGIKRKFLKNSNDLAFVKFLEKGDPLQSRFVPIAWIGAMKRWVDEVHAMAPCPYPATILQGRKDTTLSWRINVRLLRKKFPQSNILFVEGARHHMVNEIGPIREEIFSKMGF